MAKMIRISMILVTFFLNSCGSQPAAGYIAPQQINDPTITETTPVFEIQTERINNCDGATPNYTVSYKTVQAQKATFEVTASAGGLVKGTPLPPILEAQLDAKITASLAKDYGITTEKGHDLSLINPKGTYIEHKITWKVTKVKGLIDVIYGNNNVAQVAFDKIANVELYDRISTPVSACSSTTNAASPTIPEATAEPTLQEPAEPVQIRIFSTEGWQNTNVALITGDQLIIQVIDGEWTSQKGKAPYNRGVGNQNYICSNYMSPTKCIEPLPSAPQGSLIGKVGNIIFEIDEGTTITIQQSGYLSLRMNDAEIGLGDNDGILTVKISIAK